MAQAQPRYADRNWRRAAVQTTFERNVLPAFAGWFARLINEQRPDIVMPVETKGARLLDAALTYLDRELGTPVRVPVRYRRALDYMRADELGSKKAVVLDDATRTGRTLNSYRLRIRDCSPDADAVLVACFGALAPDGTLKQRVHKDIHCFRDCLPEAYHEELWQLTEFVVTRGLPPEVDHHIFRVPARVPIGRFWRSVVEAFGHYGQIDDHGVTSADGLLHGATLHWPTFAPQGLLRDAGPIRREGVVKLRLYGDAIRDEIIIVPMAYVELELPRRPKGQLAVSVDDARSMYEDWRGAHVDIGAVLLGRTYDYARVGEVLFNAACLTIEAELLRGALAVLDEAQLIADRLLRADREHFYRLYGASTAEALMETLSTFAKSAVNSLPSPLKPPSVDWDEDPRVHGATNAIVHALKRRYLEINEGRAETSWRSYRLPFSKLHDLVPERFAADPILVSRCLDFGLGVGSLVPATKPIPAGATILLRREYRTSEQTQIAGDEVIDLQWGSREIATEIVGAIAHFLKSHSHRWGDRGVPATVMNKVIAILKGAMPEIERTALVVEPRDHGPEALLRESRPLRRVTRLINVRSANYHVTGESLFEPTSRFEARYRDGALEITKRGILPLLEGYLTSLVPVLDNSGDVAPLLLCWSMTAAGRLGLDYVMHDVEQALVELDDPVEVLRGGDELERKQLTRSCARARDLIAVARSEKLRQLERDWSEQVRESWVSPLDVQRRLLASLNAPGADAIRLLVAADAFCEVALSYMAVVESLTALDPQPSLLPDDAQDVQQLLARNFATITHLRAGLQSLREPDEAMPAFTLDTDVFSEHLVRFADVLKQFVAAYRWRYDSMPGQPELAPRTRSSVILIADLARSTYKASSSDDATYAAWANAGLNLIAQWGCAFGAREIPIAGREGDDICLEFFEADAAILCACVVAEHFAALRSMGNDSVVYSVHWGVDQGSVTEGDGRNRLAPATNRASHLAKAVEVDQIAVTPDVAHDCSPDLRPLLVRLNDIVELGPNDERGRIQPYIVDRAGVISAYVDRLRALGHR